MFGEEATLLLALAVTRRTVAYAQLGALLPEAEQAALGADAAEDAALRQLGWSEHIWIPAVNSLSNLCCSAEVIACRWRSSTGREMAKTTLRPTVAHVLLRAASVALAAERAKVCTD